MPSSKRTAYKVAWKKEKRTDPAYRDKENEQQRIRRASTNDEVQKEKTRIRAAKWKKANLGRVLANTTLRKRYVKLRTPTWLTTDDLWVLKELYILAALRTKMHGFKWHVDHIIPLQGKVVSGLHVPNNMQVIPASVNLVKANKHEVI